MPNFRPPFRLAAVAALLGGCTTMTAQSPDGSTSVGAIAGGVNFHIPGPSGCAGPIRDFHGVIENDASTGNLAKSVHARITAELELVKASCAAGREADATRQLAALKARHGYR
jgi:hypothetical protein